MTPLADALTQEQPLINAALSEAITELPAPIRPVVCHILGPGGKRLRPLLTVTIARLLGYDRPDIYPLASAIEMFHTATLLHDDVLDNAEVRRGLPAAHKIYNTAQVILAGDALLAWGNLLVARYGNPRLTASVSEAIAQTTSGEILEIGHQGKLASDMATYLEIIAGKTAWMIRTACEIGALVAGAPQEKVAKAADYGFNLGMAFQIVDDALDFAPQSQTGKPEGGDVREGKSTPPILMYLKTLDPQAHKEFALRFSDQSFSEEDIKHVTESIRQQRFDEQTRAIADEYLQKAKASLDGLSVVSPELDVLVELINHVRNRTR